MDCTASTKGKVAIIGSGLIGRSWAMLFAGAGYKVSLYDVDQDLVTKAETFVHQELNELESKGFLRGQLSAKEQCALVQGSASLKQCVEGAIHVQECVPEKVDLKKKVFEELDAVVGDDTVLSTSSSAISSSQFTEHLKHKTHCLVSHPVNPPYYMRLVELVPAPWTSPEVLSRTYKLMEDIGQSPIVLKKEVMGFIQPRVQYALIQECLKLVLDDVISVEDVDKILTHGLGRRYAFMGPFETIHMNAEGAESYMERYADMIFNVNSDSANRDMIRLHDDPRMEKVFRELEQLTPPDKLAEKKRWRDNAIATLSQMRVELNKETGE